MPDLTPLLAHALRQAAALRRLPESTYRLQFHKGFTFRDAAAIVPYLARLGVTHCYASPYLKARPGSTHGYDVIDHNALNPELGTQADFEAWLAAMDGQGMSHILDTVPNHVGVATNDNAWWNDVLRRGPASPYATHFDIAWRGSPRPELHDKVLLPVLGGPYAQVLEKGELTLRREGDDVWLYYYDRRFPIAPETLDGVSDVAAVGGRPGEPRSFDRLDALLNRQHYRLAYWKVASDEINYRRFFDINDLAALSMERPEVFEATHDFTLRLLATGTLAGLRVDHPDGLYDPEAYFHRLQHHYVLAVAREMIDSDDEWRAIKPDLLKEVQATLGNQPNGDLPLYVTVEKILAPDEPLIESWPVHGTSGYDFLNKVNGLFVDPAAEPAFTALYHDLTGDPTAFPDLVYHKKLLILDTALASELQMLAHGFDRLAQRHRSSRDFTHNGLRLALRQVIACFPVYRSYVTSRGVSATDVTHVQAAVNRAVERNPKTDPSVFHFLRDTLLQRLPDGADDIYREGAVHLAGKFQQLTAPTTAKGIEDTAFYLYNRFVSLNEVGGEPDHFGVPPDELHRYLADRQRRWPHALSALSTHDTKRSEDVRARLNVMSEVPDEWRTHVTHWREITASLRKPVEGQPAPGPNEEYLLYQTLLGAWPLDEGDLPAFTPRVQAYMQKALREAKRFTTWTSPNEAYEAAVNEFAAAVIANDAFLEAFLPFQRRVADLGLVNSLAQTLLRLCAPGVPDTYQGSETWDFSLVDPDNRRPVDYARRQAMLDEVGASLDTPDRAGFARDLLSRKVDGRVKLFVTAEALRARRDRPGLFTTGDYTPLPAAGAKADNLFAFAREWEGRRAVVVVPRFVTRAGDWKGSRIPLPGGATKLINVFTGRTVASDGNGLAVADVLTDFPIALLLST
jgi:(1->4)-alpha-D-glucan 1-alpha-D-glucosylmutase